MKINVLEKILDYEGKDIQERQDDGTLKTLSWRPILYGALNSVVTDPSTGRPSEVLSAEDKEKCYALTMKIYSSETPDLTVDERSFILNRVKKIYPPLVCGRLTEAFEEKKS